MENNIYQEWLALKRIETETASERRKLEDKMAEAYGLNPTNEGTSSFELEGYKVKITQRLTRTVDADSLQEIAAEEGLSEHLASLFRWKPSVDMNRWKATAPEITGPLEAAITTKAGRPSFSIEILGE